MAGKPGKGNKLFYPAPWPWVLPSLLWPPVPIGPAGSAVLALAWAGSPCQLAAAPEASGYSSWLTALQLPPGQQPLQQLG